jgi:SPP1 gp7 family putative phage head morphogenesis protein
VVRLSKNRQKRPPKEKSLDPIRLRYSKLILRELKALEKLVEKHLVDKLPEMVARLDSNTRFDDDLTDMLGFIIAQIEKLFLSGAEFRAKKIAKAVGAHTNTNNKVYFSREYKKILGIDPLQREPWLRQKLDLFVTDNINLIVDVEEEYLSRVQKDVILGFRRGETSSTIAKKIQEETGFSENRARLIARDQVGKLNTELAAQRAQANGVTHYTWHTNIDGRERPMHEVLDGKSFSYDKPPITNPKGEHNHPGQDIQCRCWAENDYSKLLE